MLYRRNTTLIIISSMIKIITMGDKHTQSIYHILLGWVCRGIAKGERLAECNFKNHVTIVNEFLKCSEYTLIPFCYQIPF